MTATLRRVGPASYQEDSAANTHRSSAQRSLAQETLDNDGLVMHFQPIVDEGAHIVGVEALARLRVSDDELVAPADFLDAITGTDLIVRLDLQALALSCRAASILAQDFDNAPYVACNFSALTLAKRDISVVVLAIIERFGVAPSQICIEVTETAVLEADLVELRRLAVAGVGIALDNFGAGSCSLAALEQLPLSSVKIDRWFTSSLDTRGNRQHLAMTVVKMAQTLGVPVVAEGIETMPQWDAAYAHGLTVMQGWLHSKPMPFPELREVLATSSPH